MSYFQTRFASPPFRERDDCARATSADAAEESSSLLNFTARSARPAASAAFESSAAKFDRALYASSSATTAGRFCAFANLIAVNPKLSLRSSDAPA